MAKADEPGKEEKKAVSYIDDLKSLACLENGIDGKAEFHGMLLRHIPDKAREWKMTVGVCMQVRDVHLGTTIGALYDFTRPLPEVLTRGKTQEEVNTLKLICPSPIFFGFSIGMFNHLNQIADGEGLGRGWSLNNIVRVKIEVEPLE